VVKDCKFPLPPKNRKKARMSAFTLLFNIALEVLAKVSSQLKENYLGWKERSKTIPRLGDFM
jgi:hypothetical protein